MSPTIKEVIGDEAFKRLCTEFGGSQLYIPKPGCEPVGEKLIQSLYHQRCKVKNGWDWKVIKDLAAQFQRTENRIYQIIKGNY